MIISFRSSFSEQGPPNSVSCVLGQECRDVGVAAGDSDIGVSQHLLNDGQGDALVKAMVAAECRIVWVPASGVEYSRDEHGHYQPDGILVLTVTGDRISGVSSFGDLGLLTVFGSVTRRR